MPPFCRSRYTAALIVVLGVEGAGAVPFTLQGPGVNPGDFQVTTFATGLNFPVGMTTLADGSLLVATSNGSVAFNSTTSGSLIRVADTNGDGVADVQQTLVSNVPGGKMTSVRRSGNIIAVTGFGKPITFYRTGASPAAPLTQIGQVTLTYPITSWEHENSSLLLRDVAGQAGQYELYFQVGSDSNFANTTRTVSLSSSSGFTATLAGDAVHRLRLADNGTAIVPLEHKQIATGLRNASGLAFHPQTGDFYIGENGIDGLSDPNEPLSADELNFISAGQVGGSIADFGFADTYERYRTGVVVGSRGTLPLVTFQPIPMPNGSESEGVNEIAFAPPAFPAAVRDGLFAGFHGRYSLGGVANEENPVVFVDLATHAYFHFVGNQEPEVGHPDGFAATYDSLYISDMSPTGDLLAAQAGTGRIYAVRSLVPGFPGDFNNDGTVNAADYVLLRKNGGSPDDYNAWRTNFGRTASGSGSAAIVTSAVVPEPLGVALVFMAACIWLVRGGR